MGVARSALQSIDTMAPVSASKAKRLEAKAAKAAAKGESVSSKSSARGSKVSTPLTTSANGSTDDLNDMAKLRLATDRSGSGVLSSDPHSRHIHIDLVRGEAEPSDMTAIDYIVQSAKDKAARIEQQIEELALELKYEELEALDPTMFEAKVGAILTGLGFGKEMMGKATKDMSGGWRMRVSLAKALAIRPHLLLLDEPTNHLDLEAVVWLEAYLSTYNHILVFTSHSADFMDTVCTNILDLTLDKKLTYYGGNYSTYVRTKTENETNQMKAYAKQQEEIAHIKKFIASAGTYANLVKQAKSKQKIIDKMEAAGLVTPVQQPRMIKFDFESVAKL